MQCLHRSNWLTVYTVAIASLAFQSVCAAEFEVQVVDVLKKPLNNVRIKCYVTVEQENGDVEDIVIARARTNSRGIAAGEYDETRVPPGQKIYLGLSKRGYPDNDFFALDKVLVYAKGYLDEDVDRALQLHPKKRSTAVRNILSEGYWPDIGDNVFVRESELCRPMLQDFLNDKDVARSAASILVFMGYPEDIRTVLKKFPPRETRDYRNFLCSQIAYALFDPVTEEEWDFLRRCAIDEFQDGWADAAALQTLSLLDDTRRLDIFNEVKQKNRKRVSDDLIARFNTAPPALMGEDISLLAGNISKAVSAGTWESNEEPRRNTPDTIALVDMFFRSGRCGYLYTAVFHRADNLWKLRGLHYQMHMTLAIDADKAIAATSATK